MRLHITLLLAILAVAACPARTYRTLPPDLDGSMSAYTFSTADTIPVWPDSLRPVKVAYAARHGARYLSSPHKTDAVKKTLEAARKLHGLSPDGEAMLSLLDSVERLSEGEWGALSAVGADEERRLGRQLATLCPELIAKGRVSAVSSYVPRVVMTMYEFCRALADASSDCRVATSEGKQYNPVVRFFSADSDYREYIEEGPWRKTYEDFVEATVPVEPALRLVGRHSALDSTRLRALTLDIYGVLQGLRAFSTLTPTTRWMSEEQYAACRDAVNLRQYLTRTANPVSSVAPRSAAPLLESMLAALLNPEGSEVSLWFGHAETMWPLLTLMGLPGCDLPDLAPSDVASAWRGWAISPLGANVMVITLETPSGARYASVRLNGRFVAPLPGNPALTVPFQDLAVLWLDRIAAFR